MKHLDSPNHSRGRSPFLDDLAEPADLLHAAVFVSPVAHGTLRHLDTTAAASAPGVVRVFGAADIPGENQIGNIILDEPLLAVDDLHFIGQPVAVVLADSPARARRAAALIEAEIDEHPGVFEPREALAKGQLIAPSRVVQIGHVDGAWEQCHVVVEGRATSGGQEHLYLETQAAMSLPADRDRIRVLSSTQAPTAVQRITARVLGEPMHKVEVEVARLGGAFGGKEDQATPWAAMTALGCRLTGRPVKLVLNRHEDMCWTGKRHPYDSDFRIGVDRAGKILAYEATFHQNAGAAADLSTAILERSLFHATNSYFVPNVRVTAHSCRTNLPPFTAFRGFGAPQAMFVFESALSAAADALGVDRLELQRKNLLADGDPLPFGMKVDNPQAARSFAEAETRYEVAEIREEIDAFNERQPLVKRGLALMPVCFGISFTSTFLNQAGALVHVYSDGSITVSTGAVEMGQGVNAKIQGIAARALGVPVARVTVGTTATTRVANTSPTAASSGADMNGAATLLACQAIRERLLAVAARKLGCEATQVDLVDGSVLCRDAASDLDWDGLVWQAYLERVNLSAQAHYATPGIHYDRSTESGKPFAYHVFGTAVVEASVDCLRGTASIDRVSVVHDAGTSLDPLIDRGQLEGGLVQGLGWMTMEELVHEEGRLLSNSLTTYKVPDLLAIPDIRSVFLEGVGEPAAVLASKAIGEPPFMYGIGAYFAILDAMRAFRAGRRGVYDAPLTSEKILRFLYE